MTEIQIEFTERLRTPSYVMTLRRAWGFSTPLRPHTPHGTNLVNCARNYRAAVVYMQELAKEVVDQPSCCGDVACELGPHWYRIVEQNGCRDTWLRSQLGPDWQSL